jgi:hypothetical protein
MNESQSVELIEPSGLFAEPTWQDVIKASASHGLAWLRNFSSNAQAMIARLHFSPTWALGALAPEMRNKACPHIAAVGTTTCIAEFNGVFAGAFSRLLNTAQTPQWTIAAPDVRRVTRWPVKAMLALKRASLLRTPAPQALRTVADTADALLVFGFHDLERIEELTFDSVVTSYARPGKVLLWEMNSELTAAMAREWFSQCGFNVDPPRYCSVHDREPLATGTNSWWLRLRLAQDAQVPGLIESASTQLRTIFGLFDTAHDPKDSLETSRKIQRCLALTNHETAADGVALERNILYVSPRCAVDLDDGSLLVPSGDGEWARTEGRIPPAFLEVFPDEGPLDRMGLHYQRCLWLARALDEAQKPIGTNAQKALANGQELLLEEAKELAQEAPRPKSFFKRPTLLRGTGTIPVLGFSARIGRPDQPPAQVIASAKKAVCAWLAEYGLTVSPQAPSQADEQPTAEVLVESEGDGIWAMRFDNRKQMQDGNIWRVELTLASEPYPSLGVRVAQVRSKESAPPAKPAVPRVVHSIAAAVGMHERGRLLRLEAWQPITSDEVRSTTALMLDVNRIQPLVIVAGGSSGELGRDAANKLATRLLGVASVLIADTNLTEVINRDVGRALSVYGHAARVYLPGLSPTVDPFAHPVFKFSGDKKRDIRKLDDIVETCCAAGLEPRLLDERVPSYAVAREAIFARRVERALEATKRHATTATEERDRLNVLVQEQAASIAAMKERIDGLTEGVKSLQAETKALKRERDDARDMLRAEQHKNKLAWQVGEDTNEAAEEPDFPERWDDLIAWAQTYGKGRLIILPQAVKAARASAFADIPFAYRVLHLLADGYVPMKLRDPNDDQPKHHFDEQCKLLGVEVSGVGKGLTDRRYAREYKRTWQGTEYTLDMHVSRGGGFDPTTLFRCYFAFDEKNRRVIVGHLPTHLTNSITHTG